MKMMKNLSRNALRHCCYNGSRNHSMMIESKITTATTTAAAVITTPAIGRSYRTVTTKASTLVKRGGDVRRRTSTYDINMMHQRQQLSSRQLSMRTRSASTATATSTSTLFSRTFRNGRTNRRSSSSTSSIPTTPNTLTSTSRYRWGTAPVNGWKVGTITTSALVTGYFYYCYFYRCTDANSVTTTSTTTIAIDHDGVGFANTTTTTTTVTQCEGVIQKDNDDDSTSEIDSSMADTLESANKTTTTTQLDEDNENDPSLMLFASTLQQDTSILQRIHSTLRILLRCLHLTIVFSPIIVLYPIYYYCSNSITTSSSGSNDDSTSADNNKRVALSNEQETDHWMVQSTYKEVVSSSFSSENKKHERTKITVPQQFVKYYYKLCLYCIEHSYSVTIIKFMQWLSSRPDLFGKDLCTILTKLQDSTNPHSLYYTHQFMQEAYGPNWQENITLHEIIGSGCIGQVYRGTVKIVGGNGNATDHARNKSTALSQGAVATTTNAPPTKTTYKEVAIKVVHPHIHDYIDIDLYILYNLIQFMVYMDPPQSTTSTVPNSSSTTTFTSPTPVHTKQQYFQYLNVHGILNDFYKILKLQMNLQYEYRNLQKFNTNFKDNPHVVFPQVLEDYPPTTPNVLIETYCHGIPLLQYCRDVYNSNIPGKSSDIIDLQQQQEQYRKNIETLKQLCYHGISAVCQMIFIDNFVHGDLHPGNVFVSCSSDDDSNSKSEATTTTTPTPKFVLLDVGIVNEYSDADHSIIIDILSAFIRKDGRRAGRLMIDDSNSKLMAQQASHSNQKDIMAVNEEEYIKKIELLTIAANDTGYFMKHLGTYINYICESAVQHHIQMNASFVTAALAVKIQEGIALVMDPNCSIYNIAIPIILESERRRYIQSVKDTITETISSSTTSVQDGMRSWHDWVFGMSNSNSRSNNNSPLTSNLTNHKENP